MTRIERFVAIAVLVRLGCWAALGWEIGPATLVALWIAALGLWVVWVLRS